MSKRSYIRKNYKDMIGIYKNMNCGIKAKIIEYNSYGNILIEFEDGYIIKTTCQSFENGIVKNPNVQYSYTNNRLGEERVMSNGQTAKIIRYGYCDDIDIQFEDGTIKSATYGKFNIGCIVNPNINNSPTKYRLGEEKINNQGSLMKIIEYNTCDDIVVEFQDGYRTKTTYGHFKNGEPMNPYYPTKFGVGYLGNSSAMTDTGEYKKSYKYWSNMLRRCYFDKTKCYEDVFVCDEWLCFENFEKWYNDNYKECGIDLCLDKDIISYKNGYEKIYSPKNCRFIPKEINSMFKPNQDAVFYYKNGFQAKFGKKYLGRYQSRDEALKVYNKEKCNTYRNLANKYKQYISDDVFNILFNYKGEK